MNVTDLMPRNLNITKSMDKINLVKDLELQLMLVEQHIQDYLERVEFCFEEPDVERISKLQGQRLKIKSQLIKAKPSSVDLANLVFKVNELESTLTKIDVLYGNTSSKEFNKLIKSDKSTSPELTKVEGRVRYLETQVNGLKSALKKEREVRASLMINLATERRDLLRLLYEVTINHKPETLNWLKEIISNDPQWGTEIINKRLKSTSPNT